MCHESSPHFIPRPDDEEKGQTGMTRFFRRVLEVGVIVAAVFARVWERIERLFRSKADVARRASGRVEALKRREMEVERLDRLRHPRDYQGR